MPKSNAIRRDAALVSAIQERCRCIAMSQERMAKQLGLSVPYLRILMKGDRWFGTIGHDKLERIASFLQVPLLSVYMLADVIQPEDCFRTSSVEEHVDSVFEAIVRDWQFSKVLPTRDEWLATPLRVRQMFSLFCKGVGGTAHDA